MLIAVQIMEKEGFVAQTEPKTLIAALMKKAKNNASVIKLLYKRYRFEKL